MKHDVIEWAQGRRPSKIISKETLNHRGIIEMAGGVDVYKDTKQAYIKAYQSLGIDIINRVPLENAPMPTEAGGKREHPLKPEYTMAALGVYDTVFKDRFPCADIEQVWDFDIEHFGYEDLLVPVPHPCCREDIKNRTQAIGQTGLYYPMLYTTAFMWPVEVLGWEVFMLAASLEPERFFEKFLLPCSKKSVAIAEITADSSDSPFVFFHDDLCNAQGPVFHPDWYDRYIFPLYKDIFAPAKKCGKKIIFVADGNMSRFLGRLIEHGVDGIMFENPATPVEAVVEHFGCEGRFFIGGIDTAKLTFESPENVRQMVIELYDKCGGCSGFAISSCGGLHGNIPMENLIAYFDARAEIGATPKDWRKQ